MPQVSLPSVAQGYANPSKAPYDGVRVQRNKLDVFHDPNTYSTDDIPITGVSYLNAANTHDTMNNNSTFHRSFMNSSDQRSSKKRK